MNEAKVQAASPKDRMIAQAIAAALAGGRTFGQAQHKTAIGHILGNLELLKDPKEQAALLASIRDAICEMANISAFQQRLEKAGMIDRAKKIGNDVLMQLLSAP